MQTADLNMILGRITCDPNLKVLEVCGRTCLYYVLDSTAMHLFLKRTNLPEEP